MRPFLLLAPLALASPFAVGCGHDAPSVPKSAIAVVGDRTIPRAEFVALMKQARHAYAGRGTSFPAPGTPAYTQLASTAVRLLVERAELEQKAPGLGVEVTPAQVEARRRLFIEQSFAGSMARYRARLRAEGTTDAQVRDALYAQLLSDALFQAVTADTMVSTATAKRWYESHLVAYSTPAGRTVRHILVRTKEAAVLLYRRLRRGASFAALAGRFSLDTTTRDRGGVLTLVEGRTAVALDRTAFALADGALSRPFQTRFGWEIVQAVSPVRDRRTTPFAEVREPIRRQLLTRTRRQAFSRWLDGLRREFASRTAYAKGFAPTDGG